MRRIRREAALRQVCAFQAIEGAVRGPFDAIAPPAPAEPIIPGFSR
ncbi:hypothetical protein [Salinarimonas soli]|nr:hypothetical protein [Salinarimonas soli]